MIGEQREYTRTQLERMCKMAKQLGFDDDAEHWQSLIDRGKYKGI